MYDPHNRNPFSITRSEALMDSMSFDRFREILNDPLAKLVSHTEDSNSFGDFHFLTVVKADDSGKLWHLMVYTMGYHEYRQRNITNVVVADCTQDYNNRFADAKAINKSKAIDILLAEQSRLDSEKLPPQDHEGEIFELLAEVGDEDGALAEMEDMGDISAYLADMG